MVMRCSQFLVLRPGCTPDSERKTRTHFPGEVPIAITGEPVGVDPCVSADDPPGNAARPGIRGEVAAVVDSAHSLRPSGR